VSELIKQHPRLLINARKQYMRGAVAIAANSAHRAVKDLEHGRTQRIKMHDLMALLTVYAKLSRGEELAPLTAQQLWELHYDRIRRTAYNAIARCTNEKHPLYKFYGARGIKVWQPWIDTPIRFADYLVTLEGWGDPNLWLDRIDNNGHYEPNNLRFVLPTQSAVNRRPRTNASAIAKLKERIPDTKSPAQLFAVEHHKQLKIERRELGITQEQIAVRADVQTSYISSFERGRLYGIGDAALHRILQAYAQLERTDGSGK
jgi:hypothetical protein